LENFIVISGASGGGKSTLLKALKSRGYNTVEEAGRRIVEAELMSHENAVPWKNMSLFLQRAIDLSRQDYERVAKVKAPTFFDRSLVDLILAYKRISGSSEYDVLLDKYRYASRVYFVPPWPEIFINDTARQHSLEDAINEYQRLKLGYPTLGYDINIIPKATIQERTHYILKDLS